MIGPTLLLAASAIALPLPQAPTELAAHLSGADWAALRAARDAARHAVRPDRSGWTADNPGQGLVARFDGATSEIALCGASTDTAAWSFGLALSRLVVDGAARQVTHPEASCADGGRVHYDWDSTLTEWWVNHPRGLEHGFTVHAPPMGGATELTLALEVLGDLAVEVTPGGRGARLLDGQGAHVLDYAGLVAFDATGRDLAARLESSGNELRLHVDLAGACYPVTIDPLVQSAYLKASNTGDSDSFGAAIAVSGDTVVIGASFEDSNATGVNGNATNELSPNSGAAYVFVRSSGAWVQQAYLKASNTGPGDFFGYSVAISGDTIVVGGVNENNTATGVNGNQNQGFLNNSGSAYVFVRSGGVWTQQAYLKASNTGENDLFGASVAASGDTVAVGAWGEASAAFGVNGNQLSNAAVASGAVYVFRRTGTTWAQEAYIKASNTTSSDRFGHSVSLSGDILVVGAPQEDSAGVGVNGSQTNSGATFSGAAYVFVRTGTTWAQTAYLKASNTNAQDQFGYAVAVDGGTIVVGARHESSAATGVGGDQLNNAATRAGAAYVFVTSGGTWQQQAYLKATNTGAQDAFGTSVAVSGNRVLVGAPFEDSAALGLNGDGANNTSPDSGAAYVFARNGATWQPLAYVKASNTGSGDQFGVSLALDGATYATGAQYECSNATGVNGDQLNNSLTAAGAAYVFDVLPPGPIGTSYCGPANTNSAGLSATIRAVGSTTVAEGDVTLVAEHLPLNAAAFFVTSRTQFFIPNAGGSAGDLCLGGAVGRGVGGVIVNSGLSGSVSASANLLAMPEPSGPVVVLPGDTWNFQCWYRDSVGGITTSNFTDGVSILFN